MDCPGCTVMISVTARSELPIGSPYSRSSRPTPIRRDGRVISVLALPPATPTRVSCPSWST
jgi:hypothetical protein